MAASSQVLQEGITVKLNDRPVVASMERQITETRQNVNSVTANNVNWRGVEEESEENGVSLPSRVA